MTSPIPNSPVADNTWVPRENRPQQGTRPAARPAPPADVQPPRWFENGWNASGTWTEITDYELRDECPPWIPKDTAPGVFAAWHAAMQEVKFVGKTGWNKHQEYYFRGVDDVVSAVGTGCRKAGLMIRPVLLDKREDQDAETSNRKGNRRVVVRMTFVAIAVDGSRTILAENIPGEATDTADKAVAKAMSVALRTALVQAFLIPTGDPDPDKASATDKPAQVDPAIAAARTAIHAAAVKYFEGRDDKPEDIVKWIVDDWANRFPDANIGDASAADLVHYGEVAFPATWEAPAPQATRTTPVTRNRR